MDGVACLERAIALLAAAEQQRCASFDITLRLTNGNLHLEVCVLAWAIAQALHTKSVLATRQTAGNQNRPAT